MRLSYPTHFSKSRGSVIKNTFIEYKAKLINIFARRNVFIYYSPQMRQNMYSIHVGILCAPAVTHIIVTV